MFMKNEELLGVLSDIGSVSPLDYSFVSKKLKIIDIELPQEQYNQVLSEYKKIDRNYSYCIQSTCKNKMNCERFVRGLQELPKTFIKNSGTFLLKENKEECFEKESQNDKE